jgi:2-polyprenyl-6-methoxyphenol hydroxylase-like FAD-dependent oxidoreductase
MTVAWVGMPALHFRDEIDNGVAAAFHRLAAATAPDLAARVGPASRPAFFRLYPGTAGFMRRPWGPGWVLVGDAGYYKDPITAHGMSDALRDSDLVSRAIVDVLGGARSEAAAMSDFHQTRDRLSMPLFNMTNRIAAYGWVTATVGAELRVLSASMDAEVEHLLALDGAARMSA